MKLRNVLIVVKDIEQSKKYYHDLFGLEMLLDNGGNMILSEGLVLQEEDVGKIFYRGMFCQEIIIVSFILRRRR